MSNINTISLGNPIPENFRLLFAPYSNIAQCNIHNVLTYISKRIGLTPEEYFTDQHLQELTHSAENGRFPHEFSLDDAIHNTQDLVPFRILSASDYREMLPEQKAKLKELFDEHFKMLRPFYNADMSTSIDSDETVYLQYCVILKNLLIALNCIRNLTSHKNAHFFNGQESQYESACHGLLYARRFSNNTYFSPMKNGLYDSAKRVITERFNLSSIVTSKLDRFKSEGRKFVENKDFYLKLDAENGTLSGAGMLFLVCLFLTKKQTFEFVQGLQLNIRGVEQRLIGELLSVYRIVLPKNKMQSIYPDVAYALDMVNELRKCPNELFENLSPADQQKLRIEGENDGEFKKLLVRNSDRFSYFAQRYIDSMQLFKKIRFQVSLGKYRYKFYNKQCVDSSSANRVRILQKELNGFGRLDEIENLRTEKWSGLIRDWDDVHKDSADEEPYITDQHAGYVVFRNKIGLFYPTEANKQELNKMEVVDGNYLPKIQPDKAECMAPVCWLSVYELPALIFHLLICGNTEERIIECVDSYYNLFNDVAEGKLTPLMTADELKLVLLNKYHIEVSSVPGNIVDYLTGKTKDIKKAIENRLEDRITREVQRTRLHIERINRDIETIADPKANRLGSSKHVDVKPGRLAGLLMEDIVRLMPSNDLGNNKPTGMNYSVMQSALATYCDGNIDPLNRMFVSAGITQGKLSHPFLQKVLSKCPKNTTSLYRIYLEERLRYVEGLLKKSIMGKTQGLMDLSFLIKGNKWIEKDETFYKQLAKRYLQIDQNGTTLQKTIDLPRNIFFDDVKAKLLKICAQSQEMMELLNTPEANMAMIINGYFKYMCQDGNQDFYGWSRNYAYLNQVMRTGDKAKDIYMSPADIVKLYGDKSSKERVQKNIIKFTRLEKTDDKSAFVEAVPGRVNRMYNDMCDTEKSIRRYKLQDFIILEMAKKILYKYDQDSKWNQIKLQEISASSEEGIFDKPVSFTIKMKSGNAYNKRIKVENVKIKDMSKVSKIKSDNRIPTLLDLIGYNDIPFEEIQKELENYDRDQINIFVEIAKVEDLAGADGGNFGNMIRDINPDNAVIPYNDSKTLVNIRNSFSHNSYLKSRSNFRIPQVVLDAKADMKSKSMYDIFSNLMLRLKQILERNQSQR